MKKICRVGLMLLGISILSIILKMNVVEAATATITDSKTVTQGDSVTITAKTTAGAWNLTLSGAGQTKRLVGQTSEPANANASTSITFTASSTGTYQFTLTGDITDYTTEETTSINKTATITVKAKETTPTTTTPSTNNGGSTTTTTEPTFSSVNETVYATSTVNVRESYSSSSSKVGSLNAGDSVTRTGVGSNGWSRITFNGKTAYVSSSYLTKTKPEKSNNKALSSLKVTPGEISPEFDAETTNYEMTVDLSVTEIKVDAVAADEKAKVEVTGNTELKEGENTITIKVTAEDETVRNYTITVLKKAEEPIVLSSLTLKNANLTPAFSKDVYTYEATLTADVEEIEIDAIASLEEASIEVIGNENLIDGSIIRILVYSGEKDAEDTVITEYRITIHKELQSGAIAKTDGEVMLLSQNHILYIATVVLVTIALIALFTARYFTTKSEAKKEEQKDDMEESENVTLDESIQEQDMEKQEEKEDLTEEIEKKENSKGKHSL